MLASRLLIQRNNERFLIVKIKQALYKLLEKVKCQSSENPNILEMIEVIGERIHESWNNYDNILVKNKELIRTNNLQKEELDYLNKQEPHPKYDESDESICVEMLGREAVGRSNLVGESNLAADVFSAYEMPKEILPKRKPNPYKYKFDKNSLPKSTKKPK